MWCIAAIAAWVTVTAISGWTLYGLEAKVLRSKLVSDLEKCLDNPHHQIQVTRENWEQDRKRKERLPALWGFAIVAILMDSWVIWYFLG
jgi:hypothetical protein